MAKKQTNKSVQGKKRQQALGAIIVLLALFSAMLLGYLGFKSYTAQQVSERKERIVAIYESLNLPEGYQDPKNYRVEEVDIFGDKRVYEYDKGRSYSSSIRYTRGATVTETVADLDKAIKNAGFTFIDEPYPGSTFRQYHYKSEKGEYIRITVSSKPRDDALRNDGIMGRIGDIEAIEMDADAAPSNIIIKVNLDDNNE